MTNSNSRENQPGAWSMVAHAAGLLEGGREEGAQVCDRTEEACLVTTWHCTM